jgi:hypothetical protein
LTRVILDPSNAQYSTIELYERNKYGYTVQKLLIVEGLYENGSENKYRGVLRRVCCSEKGPVVGFCEENKTCGSLANILFSKNNFARWN